MGEGSTRFFVGTLIGAVGGFAAGSFVASPTAKSFGQSTVGGLAYSVRFLSKQTVRAADVLGSVLEDGYTRIRGREAYLEREIQELRQQITRLEQRMD